MVQVSRTAGGNAWRAPLGWRGRGLEDGHDPDRFKRVVGTSPHAYPHAFRGHAEGRG